MSKGTITIVNSGLAARLEILREDGYKLSQSSLSGIMLIRDKAGRVVSDYGSVVSAPAFLRVVADFLGYRVSALDPSMVELSGFSADEAIAVEA